MKPLRYRVILLAAMALLLALPAGAAGPTTTAADLLQQVQRNVAFVGKAVQQSGLAADDRRVKPFLQELRKLSLTLDSLETRAGARDPKAFDDLREAGLSEAAVQSTWSVSGASAPAVTGALQKLDSAFTAYRSSFGREAALIRDGDALSADQARELARLQDQNRKLVDRLGRLEGQVAQNGALQSEVRALRSQASRLSQMQPTAVDYVGALVLAEALAGRWRGIYGWVSFYQPSWVLYFDPYVTDWVVWNDLTVGSVDLVAWNASDWTWYDAPVDVSWNVDYTVDLTDQEMTTYESYVEQQMVDVDARDGTDATDTHADPDATPDMTGPDATDGSNPSPDLGDPAPGGDSPGGMDEGPGGMDSDPGGTDSDPGGPDDGPSDSGGGSDSSE